MKGDIHYEAKVAMQKVQITIGGSMIEDASRRFIEAWHRAERGETFCERYWSFENRETYLRCLAGRTEEEAIKDVFGDDVEPE